MEHISEELDSNWQWGIDKIQKHKEEVQKKLAAGEKVSSKEGLKNIGRFGNELVYNPWGNAELLDKARSNDASGGRILRDLFNAENQHLSGVDNSYQLSKGDTVHHWQAQRTGGNTVINLPHAERIRFHENLADSPYILGNRVLHKQRNLISFMRSFHLDGDKLKGNEATLNNLGAFQAKDLNTPKAHRIAASNPLISGTHNTQSGADAFSLMEPQMALQDKHSQEAFDVMRPIQQRISALVGLPGVDEGSSALERKELRQAISDNAPAVEELIRKQMAPLLKSRQTEVLKRTLNNPLVNKLTRGGGVLAAGALTTLGAIGDAQAAVEGTTGSVKNTGLKKTKSLLETVSGLVGLASLKQPILGIPAVVFAGATAAVDNRITRDKTRQQTQEYKANPRAVNPDDNHTLTKTKPQLPVSFTGRL